MTVKSPTRPKNLVGRFAFWGIMPWHLKGNCVIKTDTGETVKCHETKAKARAHLAALRINVKEDDMAKKKRGRVVDLEDVLTDEIVRLIGDGTIRLPEGKELTGNEWEVTIIGAATPDDLVTVEGEQYIRSKNGRLYNVKALQDSTPLWDGVKVYDNHLTEDEFRKRGGMRSAQAEWLGTIVSPFWDEAGQRIKGIFKVVESGLAAKLKSAWEQGVLGSIGLSIDTFPVIKREARFEGKRHPIIEGFRKILSVDLVSEPAAGGSFDRIMAAVDNNLDEDDIDMNKEELQEMINASVADAINQVLPQQSDEAAEENTPETDEQPVTEATEETVKLDDVRALENRIVLLQELQTAGLSASGSDLVKQAFEGRAFEQDELTTFIKSVRANEAASDPTGRVSVGGYNDIKVGLDEKQRIEVEFLRLAMGNGDFRKVEHNQEEFVKDRLGESQSWQDWLNAGKPNTGNYRRMSNLVYEILQGDPFMNDDIKASEASTLATVTKNALNVMTAIDYSLQQRWYEAIVNVEEVDTIDQATLARLFGVATLDVVNAGAAYTELAQDDEEETASFVKKGNFVGVPLEDLMTDRLNYFRTIPRRLSDTWYNTLSALVAGVFTVNSDAGPVLSTTGALFNATAVTSAGGHANLLTAALSHANFSTARTAMRVQTNRPLGVGRRIQADPKYLLVPDDLEMTARTLQISEQLPGSSNNDINTFANTFQTVVVPDWTDTNNWALVADPMRFPAIWLIFPRGGQTPQLFTADAETAGAMFTNDTLRYKVRLMTYRFSDTYDCAPVADFRPLHKNNVA